MSHNFWSNWNPFKPFGRDRDEVAEILAAVLDETIDCRLWDSFLRIPMKGTPELEAIRLDCEALDKEESMDANAVVIYTPRGREVLQQLLCSLQK